MSNHIDQDEIPWIISELACEAMIKEVSFFPSFSLVSPVSNGAHDDMNFFTFIESSCVLTKYFYKMSRVALDDNLSPKEVFLKGRSIGVEAEKAMFKKTNGVNTHKGMIFVLGIVVMASTIAFKKSLSIKYIPSIIKEMTGDILEKDFLNLDKKSNLSHGEKLFLETGIGGIRMEVGSGLPSVFNETYDFYRSLKVDDYNKKLFLTLVKLMSSCRDTTILYRHNLDILNHVIDRSDEFLKGVDGDVSWDNINSFNTELNSLSISPGGSADLLAIVIFCDLFEKRLLNIQQML